MSSFRPQERGKTLNEAVTIFLNGKTAFHGWKNVTINKNLDDLVNTFSLGVSSKFSKENGRWPIQKGMTVKINIDEETVIKGHIETIDASTSPQQSSLDFGGRSKAGDLVDCTVEPPYEYKDIEFEALVKELLKGYGIDVFLSVIPKKIDKFGTKPGETVFTALDRLARKQGFLWVSTAEGNIRLTRASRARAFSEIEEGVNMKSGKLHIDETMRHSFYKVIGQSNATDEYNSKNASQPSGSAEDKGIKRFRPLTLIGEGTFDVEKATTRAQWEASVRAAKAYTVSVRVVGWRQANGILWGVNQLVRVRSKRLGVDSELLAASITHIDNDTTGPVTDLNLIRPDAYTPSPVKEEVDDLSAILGF